MEDIEPPLRFASTGAPKAFRFKPKIATPTVTAAADPPIDEASVKILEAVAKREAEAVAKRRPRPSPSAPRLHLLNPRRPCPLRR
jgi:hypothetical protein